MANREGKEGWPISAVVRADWHAFTQNQVPEVEWGAEGSLRWVRWVGSLGGWVAGWVPVAGWLCWDQPTLNPKTASLFMLIDRH